MDRRRVGIALYNSDRYLAAHEPLEALWLEASADERDDCLQGLIQASAAIYKAEEGNDSGAVGLAESALGYLPTCDNISVDALGQWLSRLSADPSLINREKPPELHLDGNVIDVHDLTGKEVLLAGEAVAETDDDEVLTSALAYVESDISGEKERTPLVTLVGDYITEPLPIVRQRLRERVDRREMRESDVDGLFK